MLKKLKIKTQLMSAAMVTGMLSWSTGASAQSFNKYVEGASSEVTNVPQVVAFISYLGGFVLAALGVVGLKQHVENPSQNPMKNALAKLGFGGMLLALPPVVNAIQGSGDAAGASGATSLNEFGGVSGIGGTGTTGAIP